MRIAVVASEATPFAKTGGLADVAGALPKALLRLGQEAILILPLYQTVRESGEALEEAARIQVPVGGRMVPARVMRGQTPGSALPVYFVEQDAYFDRPGIYGPNGGAYADNCERFVFFSRAAIEAVRALDFRPDVFHVHDWQTALIPPYLRLLYPNDPSVGRAATVLTIHNLAYQGVFWHLDMNLIGLDWSHFNWKEFEFWGNLNLLKGGIVHSDVVNTVSPTYAREIMTPEMGDGLDGVLRDHARTLHGVVNGIDETVWDPARDRLIAARYSPDNLDGKQTCKRSLQRMAGLPLRKVPLAGIVSRFAVQKGLDFAAQALPAVFEREDLQCVILGDGDESIRKFLDTEAQKHPDRLKVFAAYDDRLAHRIFAGSDLCLVPSRFEPCGLTQLYALRYGSVPVARRTGGLADTVTECTPPTLAAGTATGFLFDDPTPSALAQCLHQALELHRDRRSWRRLQQIGMAQDWSWDASAHRYEDLYLEAAQVRGVS